MLLFVLTYPVIEPDYGCGLDASYVWAFNWLFDNDYNTLTRLIYPYGPFLWLKMPALQGCHFVVFLIFFFVVKCFFVWQGLDLARRNGCGFLPALVFIIPGCVLANIDVFLVFDVAFVVILWLEKQRWTWFATASVMAVFTMMIKVSIGIQTCSILFVGWVIAIFEHRNLRQTAWAALSAVASVLLVGLAVYRSFPTMIQAYVGIPHLVTGYSDALVLMPEHKLWSMLLFLVATATLMVLANSKRARWLSLLMIIPLFAFWKYSIVREDFWHFEERRLSAGWLSAQA